MTPQDDFEVLDAIAVENRAYAERVANNAERTADLATVLRDLMELARRTGSADDAQARQESLERMHGAIGMWLDTPPIARMLVTALDMLVYSAARSEAPGPAVRGMIRYLQGHMLKLPTLEQQMLGIADPAHWAPPPPVTATGLTKRVPGDALKRSFGAPTHLRLAQPGDAHTQASTAALEDEIDAFHTMPPVTVAS